MSWIYKFNSIFGKLNFLKNNINTSNTEKMSKIILPGHYRLNHSSDDAVQIIRVLGEADEPGCWKLSDKNADNTNKIISEYELVNNYTLLQTSITEESPKPILVNKNLLDGLTDFDDEEEIEYVHEESSKSIEPKNIVLTADQLPKHNPNVIHQVVPQLHPDEIFIINILEKISISKNNEIYDTNDQPEMLKIEVEIPIDYNFNKLRETVNLLNLNKGLVSNLLIEREDVKLQVIQTLKAKISKELNNDTKPNYVEQITKIANDEIIEKAIDVTVQEVKSTEKISSENDERIIAFQEKMAKFYNTNNNNNIK